MILINAVLIVICFFVIGLPISLFCRKSEHSQAHLALAPSFGLVTIAIVAANAYLLNTPVSKTLLPLSALAVVNLIATIAWWAKRRTNPTRTRTTPPRPYPRSAYIAPLLLLIATFLIYAIPFILDPDLIFFAYAGTDGNAYSSVAEHQISHGAWDPPPSSDLYHVYSELTIHFTRVKDGYVDKPGSMATLALASSLFRARPIEVFSSLMLASVCLLFCATFALAASLGYSPASSGLAAFIGAVSPSVLFLTSDTYLGASLTLPIFPVILALAPDAFRTWRAGVALAFAYSGYFLLSPPNWLIPPAMLGLYFLFAATGEIRARRTSALLNSALALGALAALNIFAFRIMNSNFAVFNFAFRGRPAARQMTSAEQQMSWNHFWHTVGGGPILSGDPDGWGKAALAGIVFLGAVYLIRGVHRRNFSMLYFSYLTFWLVVLCGGLAGAFRNQEILSRVSQQMVILHGLVYLTFLQEAWRVWKRPPGLRQEIRIARSAFGLLSVFVILHGWRVFLNFEILSLNTNLQKTNQHFRSFVHDEEKIAQLSGGGPILLNSSVPTYTGIADTAALFYPVRLGIPPAYWKFFFLQHTPMPVDFYCAPFVLSPNLYTDLTPLKDSDLLYRGRGFSLGRNDLMPFYDNDTFPIKYGIDLFYLEKHLLTQARLLGSNTAIHICSSADRNVEFHFRYTALPQPRRVELRGSPQLIKTDIVFGSQGSVISPVVALKEGQNRIDLQATAEGGAIEIQQISIVENSTVHVATTQ